MKWILLAFALCWGPMVLRATEELKAVQAQLYSLGLYHGEVDGKAGPELETAVRRFQIENGLAVNGEVNIPTRAALDAKIIRNPQTQTTTKTVSAKPEPKIEAAKPTASMQENDSAYLTIEPATPPQPLPNTNAVSAPALAAFKGQGKLSDTAFLQNCVPPDATKREKQAAVRAIQNRLNIEGLYNGAKDGAAGPATQEALAQFQSARQIPPTGKVDGATWDALAISDDELKAAEASSRAGTNTRPRGIRSLGRRVKALLPF